MFIEIGLASPPPSYHASPQKALSKRTLRIEKRLQKKAAA
jgi:hypothetical protein